MALTEWPDGNLTLRFEETSRITIDMARDDSDREAEAQAMDRLAELAAEAAAKLRADETDGA